MNYQKTFRIIVIAATLFGCFVGVGWAVPVPLATYVETDLGGGLWKYDYTLNNSTSDPIADAGYDLYDFFLTISPSATITSILVPANWDFISDSSSFIDWFSLFPGGPPVGGDIPPGSSLDGFGFVSDVRLGSLPFDVVLANPLDPSFPISSSGNTAPVPEPGTMLLLGSGLAGLVGYGRRRFKK